MAASGELSMAAVSLLSWNALRRLACAKSLLVCRPWGSLGHTAAPWQLSAPLTRPLLGRHIAGRQRMPLGDSTCEQPVKVGQVRTPAFWGSSSRDARRTA
jgi:hypothetical protein